MGWTVPTQPQQPPPYSAIYPSVFPEVNPGIPGQQDPPPALPPNLSQYYPAQPAGVHVQHQYFPPNDGSPPLYYQPSPLPLPFSPDTSPSAIEQRKRRRIALIIGVVFLSVFLFIVPLSIGLTVGRD